MRVSAKVLAIFSTCALVGCATQAQYQQPSAVANKAVIVGVGNSGGEVLKEIFSVPLGLRVSIRVSKVDSVKTPEFENVVSVTPGEHELEFDCALHVGGQLFFDRPTFKTTLLAGKVYTIKTTPAGNQCFPTLQEEE